MDSVENYVIKLTKRAKEEAGTFLEWVMVVRSLVKFRIRNMSMNAKSTSVFKAHDIAETMSTIHDKYAGATAYKASNKILLIGEKHYNEGLDIE